MIPNKIISPDEFKSGTLSISFPPCVPITELDQRYFSFAGTLEPSLGDLALDRRIFMGKGDSQPINSLKEVYTLATSLPWLFAPAFPTLGEKELYEISEAGTMLILAFLLQDHYLDGQLPPHTGIPLLHEHLQIAALQKYYQLFDHQSSFWYYFNRYHHQYTAALLEEKDHIGQVAAYTLQQAYKLGSGKVALQKAVITAMAIKAGEENRIMLLDHALDALGAAMQMGDDITDWKEDYEQQRYTMPLTWVIPNYLWPVPDLSVSEIHERFESSLILETLIKQTLDWFQLARDKVAHLQCSNWNTYVDNYQTITRAYQQSLVAKKILKIMSF